MWLLLLNRPDLNYTTADEELCFDYKFFSTRSFAAEFLKMLRPLQLAPSFTRFGLQNAGRRALLQTSPLFFTKSSYIASSNKSDGLATRTFVRCFLRLADLNYKKQDQKLCSRHKLLDLTKDLSPSPWKSCGLAPRTFVCSSFLLTDLNHTTQDEKLFAWPT